MNSDRYRTEYDDRRKHLQTVAVRIHEELQRFFLGTVRIDQICVRVKDTDSFVKKAEKTEKGSGEPKYPFPFREIQDQIGARVVVYFLSDVEKVAQKIRDFYTFIEYNDFSPESPKTFEYEGTHMVLTIPLELIPSDIPPDVVPEFFELQVKTLFQHAWAQAEHDVGYKQQRSISFNDKRLLALAAAQTWGADQIFMNIINSSESK